MSEKFEIDQTNQRQDKPDDNSVHNVPATLDIGYTPTFSIKKGGEINGDLYYQHGVGTTVRDAAGKVISDVLFNINWSVISPGNIVTINNSGPNPGNARLFAKNLQSGFNLTVTATMRDYPNVAAKSVIIAVKVT